MEQQSGANRSGDGSGDGVVRPFHLCKLVGFPTCEFGSGIPGEMFSHLVNVHVLKEVLVCRQGEPKELKLTRGETRRIRTARATGSAALLTPVFLLSTKVLRFLYCQFIDVHRGGTYFSFLVHVGDPSESSVKATLEVSLPGEDECAWSFSGKPFNYKDIQRAIDTHPFQISLDFLCEKIPEDSQLTSKITFHAA